MRQARGIRAPLSEAVHGPAATTTARPWISTPPLPSRSAASTP